MAKKKQEKTVFRTIKEFKEMFFPKQTRKQELEEAVKADEIGRKLARESLDMIEEAMREE
ncbi:MAG: hypothetical protein DRN20_05015 [Thermoplasmata archaeon]|nr:MAG: hypothetical protein DRN20_05015 [Thermoplasmata archaeon]